MDDYEVTIDDQTSDLLQKLINVPEDPQLIAQLIDIEPDSFRSFLRFAGESANSEALQLLKASESLYKLDNNPIPGVLSEIALQSGFEILDTVAFRAKSAVFQTIPNSLDQRVCEYLKDKYPSGLYSHQSTSIQLGLENRDVCIATPTASGKSLVFMTLAAHSLLTNPNASVLALYPSKALIQDQLNKWKSVLAPLGLELGYIDGAVPVDQRSSIVSRHRMLVMTPDVTHAWMMSHLNDTAVRRFVTNLRLLVLDETHVYDGVFGTNMAYFLRRLQAISPVKQIISSTATIGEPASFLENLTGRRPIVVDPEADGSAVPSKTVLLGRPETGKQFEKIVTLLRRVSNSGLGRFLAFADSRRMVEQIVAATTRSATSDDDDEPGDDSALETSGLGPALARVLPFRAGYEEDDRKAIQRALSQGSLAGVVSTSALELGLDIGEIDVVLLLGTPPSVKAFRQRLGRAGRKNAGVCLLIDDKGLITSELGGLGTYLKKPPEKSWLYLGNRYLQYANALCAAAEANALPSNIEPFKTLPSEFVKFFENEVNPTDAIPDELYPLKQRAQAGPHYEFPLRSGVEKNFSVRLQRGPEHDRLGTLSYSQALREAYPGAIYHYMARPYRVFQFKYKTGEIFVRRERRYTTRPIIQNMVFPKFQGGLLSLSHSSDGFISEAELQVSERVTGFIEQRGANKSTHEYVPTSPFAQRPIIRFFETTGVCWSFKDRNLSAEMIAVALRDAFCSLCGIETRDLGIGTFFSTTSPLSGEKSQGISIYDAASGSLRLTQQLIERFPEVLDLAATLAEAEEPRNASLIRSISELKDTVNGLQPASADPLTTDLAVDSDWVTVIAAGEQAMCRLASGAMESVTVLGFRYTPQGLMYELSSPKSDVSWMVKASTVVPINGVSKLVEANLMTGELRDFA
ncbi:MAG TPA: DEAD/DEAH box helicase [Pyrinomonadaceae bacterium]|nr:DEAD/DEAH box helicase [Pyrinomonadaceae bacterium]